MVPYVFPLPQSFGPVTPRMPAAESARAGWYAMDTTTPLGEGTFAAAVAAADCALTAAELVLAGEPAAYAMCRPPGHHAGRDFYGGSCYLNNAAMAAERLRTGERAGVGIVDLDAHHGNGTQVMFYERADVVYTSVHIDPDDGWFPALPGPGRRDRGRAAARAPTSTSRCRRGQATMPWLGGVDRLCGAVAGCDASSFRSVSTAMPPTRRARSR